MTTRAFKRGEFFGHRWRAKVAKTSLASPNKSLLSTTAGPEPFVSFIRVAWVDNHFTERRDGRGEASLRTRKCFTRHGTPVARQRMVTCHDFVSKDLRVSARRSNDRPELDRLSSAFT